MASTARLQLFPLRTLGRMLGRMLGSALGGTATTSAGLRDTTLRVSGSYEQLGVFFLKLDDGSLLEDLVKFLV